VLVGLALGCQVVVVDAEATIYGRGCARRSTTLLRQSVELGADVTPPAMICGDRPLLRAEERAKKLPSSPSACSYFQLFPASRWCRANSRC
jgi:hypothetical protein